MRFRDRIKELRRVPAASLRANPNNWRRHPQFQTEALRGVLREIGFASAVLARETEDGHLELIDGHLRTDLLAKQEVPVLVLDVTEEEANTLLATFDPIGQWAEADRQALRGVLNAVATESEAVTSLVAEIASQHDVELEGLSPAPAAVSKERSDTPSGGPCRRCGCPIPGLPHGD